MKNQMKNPAFILLFVFAAFSYSANAQNFKNRLNKGLNKVTTTPKSNSDSNSDSNSNTNTTPTSNTSPTATKETKSSGKAAKGGKGLVSTTPIMHGATEGVSSMSNVNSGEELWVYIPLKEALSQDVSIGMKVNGKESMHIDYVAYESEETLTYLKFAMALNPENYMPDTRVRKEGLYPTVVKKLSELPVGEQKVTFGVSRGVYNFIGHSTFTINVTAEGKATWEKWAKELEAMRDLHTTKVNRY